MNAALVIRNAIPGASEALMEHIVWGRTPYPVGSVTPKSLYKAARGFLRARNQNVALCDWCERKAGQNSCVCESCEAALSRVRSAS